MSEQLKIAFPIEGELLNHTHGEVIAPDRLAITVSGASAPGHQVAVNGVAAAHRADGTFSARVELTGEFPVITANDGVSTLTVRPAVHTDSSKRYNFFIDDNIFFFTDLVRNSRTSIFDSFYLAGLRRLHEKYGFKVTLNTFFRNDHTPFDLSEVSDRYRPEWEANADWLRLAFHAYSEFPGRPYSEHFPEKLPEHYATVVSHLRRIAGAAAVTVPAVIHFFDVDNLDSRKFLRAQGMRVLSKGEAFWNDLAAKHGRPFFSIYDFDDGLYRIPVEIILDRFAIPQIEDRLAKALAAPGKAVLNLGTHEQYAYRSYGNHIPEYFDRIELAVKMLTESGYRPVFINDGSFGAS